MAQWVRVATTSELPAGSSKEVEVDGRVVALFNVSGRILAMDGICPHQGGPLVEGEIEGSSVTCPWHGWQFDLESGRNVYDPSLAQCTYEAKVEGADIFLSLS
jgi:nitrite reductase (NADH) small subunit